MAVSTSSLTREQRRELVRVLFCRIYRRERQLRWWLHPREFRYFFPRYNFYQLAMTWVRLEAELRRRRALTRLANSLAVKYGVDVARLTYDIDTEIGTQCWRTLKANGCPAAQVYSG